MRELRKIQDTYSWDHFEENFDKKILIHIITRKIPRGVLATKNSHPYNHEKNPAWGFSQHACVSRETLETNTEKILRKILTKKFGEKIGKKNLKKNLRKSFDKKFFPNFFFKIFSLIFFQDSLKNS